MTADSRAGKAHVENTKDPIEISPPSSDHILLVCCVKESRNRISFALLDIFLLHVGHGPRSS